MSSNHPITRRGALRPIAALAAGALVGSPSRAQTYPNNRAITMLFPAAPGSPSDLIGRQVAKTMQSVAGVPVVADNRPGANGVIGVQALLNAPADGHTLMFTTMSTVAVNKALIKNLPYEPQTDLIPLAVGYRTWLYLVTSARSPYKTVADLVAASKSQPGKVNFGYGTSIPQMCGKLFEQRAGMQFTFIPYKSHPMMMQALVAGEVDVTIVDPVSFGAFVKGGQLRLLAAATPSRFPAWVETPTMTEAGVPNFEISSGHLCIARAGTPPDVVARLTEWLVAASKSTELNAFLAANNADAFHVTGAEAARYMAGEIERWGSIARSAGLQPV
jgi:tripartite-type tricarboxylate transporter receptor subunit TctC